MTHLFISSNNEYPRHMGDILLDDPTWDGTVDNLPEGWKPVTPVNAPEVMESQVAYELFPTLVGGVYFQTWGVRELTQEEIDAKNNKND